MILKEQKAYLDHVLSCFYNNKADKMDLMRAANELYCDVQVKYLLTRRFIGSCSPAYAKQVACDCLKILNRALYDRRKIVGNIDEAKLAKLLKGISDCWEYIFEDKDCGGKKEWLELLDVSYYFISNGLKCGYYSISDTSKLFAVARSLEDARDPCGSCDTKKDSSASDQDAKCNACGQEATSEKKTPMRRVTVHIKQWGNEVPGKKLKTYKVAVRRTYYGEILIPAENEDEAIAIATGEKPMYDGTKASEHFRPTEFDAYLELNDSLDDEGMVSEVKQSC